MDFVKNLPIIRDRCVGLGHWSSRPVSIVRTSDEGRVLKMCFILDLTIILLKKENLPDLLMRAKQSSPKR